MRRKNSIELMICMPNEYVIGNCAMYKQCCLITTLVKLYTFNKLLKTRIITQDRKLSKVNGIFVDKPGCFMQTAI